jgi:S-formylglutathione hydrolase FrmB
MIRTRIVAAVLALGALIGPAARGATPGIPGPLNWPCAPGVDFTGHTDRLEQLTVAGYPISVLLPDGYRSSTTRYPVAYVIHGAGGNAESWLQLSDIVRFSADQPVILVLPGTDRLGFYSDWWDGSLSIESDLVTRVLPAIDARYRTIPDRAHRGVLGESMGGYGTTLLASHHPDLFGFAGSISGVTDIGGPGGVIALPALQLAIDV